MYVECLITIKSLILCQEVFLSYQNRFTTDNNNAHTEEHEGYFTEYDEYRVSITNT